jgi:mannose-6-phosphate isomerase-like protein (cupin superfamily)
MLRWFSMTSAASSILFLACLSLTLPAVSEGAERAAHPVRLVVTGHSVNGKSINLGDAPAERVVRIDNLGGLEFVELWDTGATPSLPNRSAKPDISSRYFIPGPGETKLRTVSFPPAEQTGNLVKQGKIDPARGMRELAVAFPDLAATHELGASGFHATPTIDYVVILSGEIDLELDDEVKVHLRPGDTVVQNGTRHAWHNESRVPCVIAAVSIGVKRPQ